MDDEPWRPKVAIGVSGVPASESRTGSGAQHHRDAAVHLAAEVSQISEPLVDVLASCVTRSDRAVRRSASASTSAGAPDRCTCTPPSGSARARASAACRARAATSAGQRHEPPHEQRHRTLQQPGHDRRAGVGADRGRCEAGGEQPDARTARRRPGRAPRRSPACAPSIVSVPGTPGSVAAASDQHRDVHGARDDERDARRPSRVARSRCGAPGRGSSPCRSRASEPSAGRSRAA